MSTFPDDSRAFQTRGMDPLLFVDRLRFGYSRERRVLQDLSFQIRPGEIVGFLGANGAGKTTTFHLINGLLKPDEGDVRVGGISPVTHPRDARRRLGFVPDEPLLHPMLSAAENLNLFG